MSIDDDPKATPSYSYISEMLDGIDLPTDLSCFPDININSLPPFLAEVSELNNLRSSVLSDHSYCAPLFKARRARQDTRSAVALADIDTSDDVCSSVDVAEDLPETGIDNLRMLQSEPSCSLNIDQAEQRVSDSQTFPPENFDEYENAASESDENESEDGADNDDARLLADAELEPEVDASQHATSAKEDALDQDELSTSQQSFKCTICSKAFSLKRLRFCFFLFVCVYIYLFNL